MDSEQDRCFPHPTNTSDALRDTVGMLAQTIRGISVGFGSNAGETPCHPASLGITAFSAYYANCKADIMSEERVERHQSIISPNFVRHQIVTLSGAIAAREPVMAANKAYLTDNK